MPFQEYDENFSLAGKNALVTGAASGIGYEIARMYLRKGAQLAIFDRNPCPALESYAKEQGARFLCCLGDIKKEGDIQAAVDKTLAFFGKIDILVNSAGTGGVDPAETLSEELWDRVLAINLKGSVRMAQAVGRSMLQNGGGKIINMGSQAGVVAVDRHLAYGASKAGVIYATKQLALEWARHNINVNCISPTVILTPMGAETWDTPEGELFKQTIPARRFGYPQEVAAAAVFLASDAASLINGENLVMDGGFTIG